MRKLSLAVAAILLLPVVSGRAQQPVPAASAIPSAIESYIEALRVQAGIPGISAVIVQDGQIVWERGFGFRDQEARLRADPDTLYPVGDLTQTLSAALILRCAEERRIEVDAPARAYGLALPEATASIRHVLSHTSEEQPGEIFRYSPERFATLARAVEACVPDQPFRRILAGRILDHLAMIDSVPGPDLAARAGLPEDLFTQEEFDRYAALMRRVAVPYRVDRNRRATRAELPSDGISAAAGLVSTVRDLARFDAALDDDSFFEEETRTLAWTNALNRERSPHPTGLGWFVQSYKGERVVWHYGLLPNAYSALFVKVPARGVTIVLLANSDGLSAPYQLHLGDVTRSPYALAFLRLFV
jgi:CubicO group peptidase (beta-lactamase class C family)